MKLLTILAIACAALALAGCDPAPKEEPTTNAAPATSASGTKGVPGSAVAPADNAPATTR